MRYSRENGTLDEKREILTALDSNFVMEGQELSITNNDWLVPIENEYPNFEEEYRGIELNKALTNTERNETFASLRLRWGAYRDSNPDRECHKLQCCHYTIGTIKTTLL